jgi:DNA-binding transcriptional LysR family regulator
MRNPAGILLDLWEFKREQQVVQVPVKGWLSSNAREAVLDMVIGGHGVGRITEITTRDHVQSGRLVGSRRSSRKLAVQGQREAHAARSRLRRLRARMLS